MAAASPGSPGIVSGVDPPYRYFSCPPRHKKYFVQKSPLSYVSIPVEHGNVSFSSKNQLTVLFRPVDVSGILYPTN